MKKWDAFYPYVLPDVPGCPDPVLDQALVLAAREFCQQTRVWQVDTDVAQTEIGIADYDFDTGSGQNVVDFVKATLNDRDLPVVAEGDLPSDWRFNPSGQFTCAFTLDRRSFTIVPTPIAVVDFTTKLIVCPSLAADGIEDFIFDQHATHIAFGAKAILLATKDKPYSDLSRAAIQRGMFENAMSTVAITQARGHSRRRTRLYSRNF